MIVSVSTCFLTTPPPGPYGAVSLYTERSSRILLGYGLGDRQQAVRRWIHYSLRSRKYRPLAHGAKVRLPDL